MKIRIFLTSVIVSVFFVIHAQSGLEFNAVKLPQVTLAAASGSTISIGTVPAGKVWKMENYVSNLSISNIYFRVNGIDYALPQSGSSGTNLNSTSPYWFPEGTTLALYRTTTNGPATNFGFSILEFTIVP